MNTEQSRRGMMTRRRALGLAGVAGAAYIASPLRPFGAGDDVTDPTDARAAATCVLAPEVTEGPYWVDTREKRSDVIAGQAGVPLTLNLYVYRSDDSCEPEQGAIVDIWHCNAEGLYSDEAVQGTTGQTWLRGYQETDSTGLARFTTTYPGWYMGRTVHIHVRVRTFSGSNTTYNFTTQIFFNESDTDTVYGVSPYSSRPGRDTTNGKDSIYLQEAQAGNVLMPTLTGSTAGGYSGSVGIGLSGLPASSSGVGRSSGSSGAGSSSTSGSNGDASVATRLLHTTFVRSGGRRELVLRLAAEEKFSAHAELLRGGRTIAQKRVAGLNVGKRSLAVIVPGSVRAGAAALRLTLTDKAGNEKVVRHRVRVPTL